MNTTYQDLDKQVEENEASLHQVTIKRTGRTFSAHCSCGFIAESRVKHNVLVQVDHHLVNPFFPG